MNGACGAQETVGWLSEGRTRRRLPEQSRDLLLGGQARRERICNFQ